MAERDEIFRWKATGPHDVEPEDVTDQYVPLAEAERLRTENEQLRRKLASDERQFDPDADDRRLAFDEEPKR